VGFRIKVGLMIREITAEETIAVRHPVLRPGRVREDAVFACDAEAGTRHFGAFDATEVLVGVVTIHPAALDGVAGWQLRGMATVPSVRGQGQGAALVRRVEDVVRGCGGRLLWCNARVAAVAFYERLGWEVVGDEFDIPTVGPHFRMIRRL
jgi:GNAT superfamily N-acetyltransferase